MRILDLKFAILATDVGLIIIFQLRFKQDNIDHQRL